MSFWKAKFGFFRNNLVFKILVVVFALTLVPMLLVLLYSTDVTKQSFLKLTSEYFTQSLNNFATAVDQKLFSLQTDVAQISESAVAVDYLAQRNQANLAKLNQEILTKTGTGGSLETIYVTDPNGAVVTSAGKETKKPGESIFAVDVHNGSFKKLLDSNQTIVDSISATKKNSGELALLNPVLSPATGKVVGYVAATYSLDGFGQLLNISSGDHIHMYNGQSQRILMLGPTSKEFDHSSIDTQYVKNQLSNRPVLINPGHDMQIAVLPRFSSGIIAKLDWRIVGSMNTQRILQDIDDFRLKVYVVTFIVLLLVDLLLVIFLRWLIVEPLNNIKIVAQQIAAGNYQKRIRVNSRSDVIGRVQYSINDMAMTLINEHFNLEQKVLAQTKELSDKVDDLEKAKSASVNLLEDLSAAKNEIEKSRNEDDALLSSIGDGVFAIDRNKKIILFNNAATKITGYSTEEALGQKYSDLLKFVVKGAGPQKTDFVETALSGKVTSMPKTTFLKHKHGHYIPVDDSAAPVVESNSVVGAIIVFRDITEELAIENTKTEFVSLASHQLRTPLTAIGWYSELLQKEGAKSFSKEEMSYLGEISEGNNRMVELVNALLNVSRLELGTVSVDPKATDIVDVIKSVEKEVQHSVEQQNQSLKLHLSKKLPKIQSDPQLIRIVIQNLMTNAIKYTPPKGHIMLSADYIGADTKLGGQNVSKGSIVVSVKDDGYGIPKAVHDKIFTKLFRADNIRTKSTNGTGLGLYMSKLLTEVLSGKLWFTSELNKGTTFYLVLPMDAKLTKGGSKQLENTSK